MRMVSIAHEDLAQFLLDLPEDMIAEPMFIGDQILVAVEDEDDDERG